MVCTKTFSSVKRVGEGVWGGGDSEGEEADAYR